MKYLDKADFMLYEGDFGKGKDTQTGSALGFLF